MLKGKRLVLRPFRVTDAPHFVEWFNDQEVVRNLYSYLPINEVAEEKWINHIMEERLPVFTIEAIMPCDERKVIGNCGLIDMHQKDRNAEFGIMIGAKSFWGQEYGTEAANLIINYGFKTLNLHKIKSVAYEFNARSIKIHEKLGFSKEGYLKDHVYIDGNYHGVIVFGLLKKDWEKTEKK